MAEAGPAPASSEDFRRLTLWGLIAAFTASSASVGLLLKHQAAGADFSCFWAGARTALQAPAKLYDFAYITGLQGWPLGPGLLRPYIYPPSALLVFAPFALAPYWVGYGLWVALTGALFCAAGLKAKAPWWFMLLPWIAFVAYCGQITFLIGGLVLLGLTLRERRILAGVLFGVAAAVKPQFLILLPIALIAERRWTTIVATAVTGALMVGLSVAIWGLQPWMEWLPALQRFQHVIFENPGLVATSVTPYAALTMLGCNGNWAFLLAPLVAVAIWSTFRRDTSLADRSIALFGGALLISPYAMNYELALLAPAVAIYLARTRDRPWLVYVLASAAYAVGPPMIHLPAALVLPLSRLASRLRTPARKSHPIPSS